nr:MAG TPA: hypothetical protein [Caudoviricetes sp.]
MLSLFPIFYVHLPPIRRFKETLNLLAFWFKVSLNFFHCL